VIFRPRQSAEEAGPAQAGRAEIVASDMALSAVPTTFAVLAAGRPLLNRLSPRYLREIGMYVYEDAAGRAHAAVASESNCH
jgi:hypothetical protein